MVGSDWELEDACYSTSTSSQTFVLATTTRYIHEMYLGKYLPAGTQNQSIQLAG